VLAALPQPPVDMVMPETAQALFTLFIFAPLGFMLVVAVRMIVKDRDPLMLICIAGGAVAMLFEAFARSFFADPATLSAAELIAMFHYYFVANPQGIGFDVQPPKS